MLPVSTKMPLNLIFYKSFGVDVGFMGVFPKRGGGWCGVLKICFSSEFAHFRQLWDDSSVLGHGFDVLV